jgi:electron transfer flavoprotein-quinone oxidoreductase
MSKAAQVWFRVDGKDKRAKEKEIIGTLRRQRGIVGLVGDVVRVARDCR